jgi:DtxR family Mn-dependent transcriptional regulator
MNISIQEYLLAIYRLQVEQDPVTTTDLAVHLGLAPASVTGMLQKLHSLGLVEHTPYQGARLTAAGQEEALRLLRIHRLWELFLTKVLGLSWDEVHAEAHRLEHATSDRLADRLENFLSQPKSDPHGQLIPSREGKLPSRHSLPLSEVTAGEMVALVEVPDSNAELLRYLGELGLYPGIIIQVLAVAPFKGPHTIRFGNNEQAIGWELAGKLLVTRMDDSTEKNID